MTAPPYDADAELAVLGAMLDSAWTGPAPDLPPEAFYVPAHSALYRFAAGLPKPIVIEAVPLRLRSLAIRARTVWVHPPRDEQRVRECWHARLALQAADEIAVAARAVDLTTVAQLAARLGDTIETASKIAGTTSAQ